MAQDLINILTKIHQELVIGNMPNDKLKELQREVFEKEETIARLEGYVEIVQKEINDWCAKNINHGQEFTEDKLKELIPDQYELLTKIENSIKSVEKNLESYKDLGLVIRGV